MSIHHTVTRVVTRKKKVLEHYCFSEICVEADTVIVVRLQNIIQPSEESVWRIQDCSVGQKDLNVNYYLCIILQIN